MFSKSFLYPVVSVKSDQLFYRDTCFWQNRNCQNHLVLAASVFASWVPLQHYSSVKYVYNEISYFENGEQKEMIYGVTIDRDENHFILNYDTTCFLPLDIELT